MDAPNILFVVMDTARARNALPTENPELLPNLARLAGDGTLFDNAVTTGPWTLPSHASMFTGQYTADHGTHGETQYFDPDRPPLAERLRTTGYRTAAVSNNTWVTPEFGFDEGFDEFYVRNRPFPDGADPAAVRNRLRSAPLETVSDLLKRGDAASTVGNALYERFLRGRRDDGARLTNWRIRKWLDDERDADRPFFLFANYIEPHLPYTPPADFLPEEFDAERGERVPQEPWSYLMDAVEMTDAEFEALETLYEAELSYLDAKIGELCESLRERDLLDETAIVVAGDHGENIGDHGLMDHQFSLYDTVLRVPLLVRLPAGTGRGPLSSTVELRDLFPTILELAGAEEPTSPSVSRRSLLDHVRGRSDGDAHREYAIAEYYAPRPSTATLRERYPNSPVDVSRYDRSLRCIRTDEWKYVESSDGREELFDLVEDPRETESVAAENAGVKERLKRKLSAERDSFSSPDGRRHEPSAETERRLDSLGYI